MKKSYLLMSLAALTLAACKPNLEPDAPNANGLDLSRYVAIGNSLTAGGADGTLYRSSQINSYPAILAEQFKTAGGGAFKQPLLPGESGWPIDPASGFLPRFVLGPISQCTGGVTLGPVFYPNIDTAGSSQNISAQGPFNNVGIFGIRAIDYLFPGYATFNPYAGRFFANPMARPLDEATRISATFFTIWLGTNDVLGYATSGGDQTPDPLGLHKISDLDLFKISYDSVAGAMTRNGAKGALINIPEIRQLPFFATIPSMGLVLRQGQADSLNFAYAGSGITFSAGANGFIIEDAGAPAGIRHMKPDELILLSTPQDSLTCAGWGSIKPIPAPFVLTTSEIANITTATQAFNSFIQTEATKYNLAYVDMASYMKTIASGIKFNGVDYSAVFVGGGTFSLDGLHLTPRGYGLVANQIIKTVNSTYGSTIPLADVNKYPGIKFP